MNYYVNILLVTYFHINKISLKVEYNKFIC